MSNISAKYWFHPTIGDALTGLAQLCNVPMLLNKNWFLFSQKKGIHVIKLYFCAKLRTFQGINVMGRRPKQIPG